MVRRHGWQYPAHIYQVVAITVFFSLAATFYMFLSPFLGDTTKEYVAFGVFSPVALAVSLLYIRCTAVDPSDPGVLANDGSRAAIKQTGQSLTSNCLSSKEGLQSNKLANIGEGRKFGPEKQSFLLLDLVFMLQGLVKGANQRKDGANCETFSQEDLLYCTLCDAEVYKFSKHCRSCDKCVEGFDHHCRWLNNCIGRKNYVSFVALMAACLIMLFVETISGLLVLIRCFTNKHEIGIHLINKLGNGFSIAPFSALVALCTLAPLLASIPLGELFFFHMLLIRKGITTFEYVIAVRAQNEPQVSAKFEKKSIPFQPNCSNARDWWNPNSVAVPCYGAWCNPRRPEQPGEGISRLDKKKLPCTVDTESTTVIERKGHRSSRHVVKISALKLAKLNPKEAAKAAMKARENSSILHPVGFRSFQTSDTDCGSSCNITPRSSVDLDYGPASSRKGSSEDIENSLQANHSPRRETIEDDKDICMVSSRSRSPSSAPLSPLPVERRFGNPNVLRTPVQSIQTKDLGVARHGLQICNATILPHSSMEHPSWVCTTPINGGNEASRGSETVQLGRSNIICVDTHANGEKCGGSRTAVYWDRAAGRFRSVPNSTICMKVANLPPKTASGDPWDLTGPNSVLSPGRSVLNAKSASLQGPWNSSTPKNCGKENFLKVANTNSRPFSIHSHVVLPSQSTNGLATFACQSSNSASRTKPKNVMLSRFTPS